MEPSLGAIFPGATQTLSQIIIPKSALTGVGMTADANNRADQISAALLILMAYAYPPENREGNPSASIVATMGNPSVDVNFDSGVNYLNRPIEFSLFSELDLPDLDPDSY